MRVPVPVADPGTDNLEPQVRDSHAPRPSANRALTLACDPEAAVSVTAVDLTRFARVLSARFGQRAIITRNGWSTTACQVVLSRSWVVPRLVPRLTEGVVAAPDPGGRPIVPA